MKTKVLAIIIGSFFTLASTSVSAEFDFCSGSSNGGGDGTFEQQIVYRDFVEIGELPAGIEGILIELKSDKDVDIQLYDKQSNEKIVHWPNGILSGENKQSTSYNGVTVEWSGFGGDGTGSGNEYIKVTGKTNRPFIMKAYGYRAGYATVNYSWTGGTASECDISNSGDGIFEQQIVEKKTVNIGDIPPGVNDLYIKLTSDKDVDVQLHDKENGTEIVSWPNGILNGQSKQSTTYQGMMIEWSGFNGDGTNYGHEYIKITGKTTRNLTMKAYGYKAGYATVEYSWGGEGEQTGGDNNLEPEQIDALALINQARSISRQCGDKVFNAVSPVTWNEVLYEAALKHSNDMATLNFFNHTGSNGYNAGTRIVEAGYNWKVYMENIAAGQKTVHSVVDGWLNSPGHCANIMNPSITEIGLAYMKNTASTYGIYWTLNGAAPK